MKGRLIAIAAVVVITAMVKMGTAPKIRAAEAGLHCPFMTTSEHVCTAKQVTQVNDTAPALAPLNQ